MSSQDDILLQVPLPTGIIVRGETVLLLQILIAEGLQALKFKSFCQY